MSLSLTQRSASVETQTKVSVIRCFISMAEHNQTALIARYIDVKDPIRSKLLFLIPIHSRKGAYPLKT